MLHQIGPKDYSLLSPNSQFSNIEFIALLPFSLFHFPAFLWEKADVPGVCVHVVVYIYMCAFLVPVKGEVRKEGRETPCVSRLVRTPGFPREWLRQQWERLRNNFLRKG